MRKALRISWLVAASFLVSRFLAPILDGILWHLVQQNFYLPYFRPNSLLQYLNAGVLLSLSVAIVMTVACLIDRWKLRKR